MINTNLIVLKEKRINITALADEVFILYTELDIYTTNDNTEAALKETTLWTRKNGLGSTSKSPLSYCIQEDKIYRVCSTKTCLPRGSKMPTDDG